MLCVQRLLITILLCQLVSEEGMRVAVNEYRYLEHRPDTGKEQ